MSTIASTVRAIADEVRKRIIDVVVGALLAVGATVLAGTLGFFDGFIKSYIFNSLEIVVSPKSIDDRGPSLPYSFCEKDEKIIGGHCVIQSGSGALQNTGFEDKDGTKIFRCAFANPQPSVNGPFKGVANAICLRSKK